MGTWPLPSTHLLDHLLHPDHGSTINVESAPCCCKADVGYRSAPSGRDSRRLHPQMHPVIWHTHTCICSIILILEKVRLAGPTHMHCKIDFRICAPVQCVSIDIPMFTLGMNSLLTDNGKGAATSKLLSCPGDPMDVTESVLKKT